MFLYLDSRTAILTGMRLAISPFGMPQLKLLRLPHAEQRRCHSIGVDWRRVWLNRTGLPTIPGPLSGRMADAPRQNSTLIRVSSNMRRRLRRSSATATAGLSGSRSAKLRRCAPQTLCAAAAYALLLPCCYQNDRSHYLPKVNTAVCRAPVARLRIIDYCLHYRSHCAIVCLQNQKIGRERDVASFAD